MTYTLWFTGLSASGKSTIAKLVEEELRSRGRDVHNLDGDNLRQQLHPGLGFTKDDRATNNRRMAVIASLLNEHDITTIIAAISPFRDARQTAKDIIEDKAEFVEIYVDCSVDVCKQRDPKGLYEEAERGNIENFTGVNHPYEPPENPDITIDTEDAMPEACADKIISYLADEGFLEARDEHTGLTASDEDEIKERLKTLGYL